MASRTSRVRHSGARVWLIALVLPLGACGPAALAGDVQQRARAAQGWLRLEQDQRPARDRLDPNKPQEAIDLGARERHDRLRLRSLLQGQEQELDAFDRRAPRPDLDLGRRSLQLNQERQLESLRLRRTPRPALGPRSGP